MSIFFSLVALLLLPIVARAAVSTHSRASFHVHLIDHYDDGTTVDDRVCRAGRDCFVHVTFADTDTTRFYIDVPYSYRVVAQVAPVKSGVCRTSNDVYKIRSTTANTLDAFKADMSSVSSANDWTDETVLVAADACESEQKATIYGFDQTVRYYFGVSQNSEGAFGACPTGRFQLRLYDNSARCGYRRPIDNVCYAGAEACNGVASRGGEARGSGDTMQCCPESRDNVLSSTTCECGGKTHLAPLLALSWRGPAHSCTALGFVDVAIEQYAQYDHLWMWCNVGEGSGRVVERDERSVYGVREYRGDRDFDVYVLDDDNMRLYQASASLTCGYPGCGDAIQGRWTKSVPAPWKGVVHFVAVCRDERGCTFDAHMSLGKPTTRAPTPRPTPKPTPKPTPRPTPRPTPGATQDNGNDAAASAAAASSASAAAALCTDCACAREACDRGCGGNNQQFTCSSINNVLEHECMCTSTVSSATKVVAAASMTTIALGAVVATL